MNLCSVLVVLSMAAQVFAGAFLPTTPGPINKCQGNGRMVRQFNGRKEDTKMPCKYNAVRQRCGKYFINLTPGNMYLFPKYRLDSLWLGVKDTESGGSWLGRTDNKLAVKYIDGWNGALFVKKDGNLTSSDVVGFNKDSDKTWVEAVNGDFRVTFVPWDPENGRFPLSEWKFECFASTFDAAGYPRHICGGDQRRESVGRMEELGLTRREQVVMYDVFTNTEITQTNPQCANVTRLMTQVCTEDQRRDAMITCSQILSSYRHTKCVSKYNCNPMDAFLDCIDWVCSDYQDNFACERVAKSIDMCRTFKGGNLTSKVAARNCYKDFLPIIV